LALRDFCWLTVPVRIVIPKIDSVYLTSLCIFSVVVFCLILYDDIQLYGKMNLGFELSTIMALDGMHVGSIYGTIPPGPLIISFDGKIIYFVI
jgi:hypothetical protein